MHVNFRSSLLGGNVASTDLVCSFIFTNLHEKRKNQSMVCFVCPVHRMMKDDLNKSRLRSDRGHKWSTSECMADVCTHFFTHDKNFVVPSHFFIDSAVDGIPDSELHPIRPHSGHVLH